MVERRPRSQGCRSAIRRLQRLPRRVTLEGATRMSELITLTGITGFVGMRIAEQALNNGYRVRATVRKLEHGVKVRSLIQKQAATDNLEFAEANLLTDYGWDEAVAGADYVIHTASPLILGAVADESVLFAPAVDGTRRVLEAAKKAKVK